MQNVWSKTCPYIEVVVVEYADLLADKDLSTEIERAFGYDGVGVLAVRGVPELERRRLCLF